MAEEYDDSYRINDAPIDPETGDYLVTFEGRRRVLGGLGTGTPDGFAPFATYAFDFFTEDMITMVHPDSTAGERALAAGFTFIKPFKIADTGHDFVKAGTKSTKKDIAHPVLDNPQSGSALKKPDGQHGFNDIIDNYTQHAKEFEIVGGDGVKRSLYQIEGGMKHYDYKDVYNKDLKMNVRITTVKDQNGVFEWIVEPDKGVTHRRFIPDGKITGSPNQRP